MSRRPLVLPGPIGPARPPVIVIGMHRSGTSMLVGMLAELGLFIGTRTDHNNESPLFLALERQLLRQCSGSWQAPQALASFLERAASRGVAADQVRRSLARPSSISYLGWARYLRYRTPANLDIPWGWKSPVSTYTLPLWLDLFPQAKVVHICRHGVDVAQSLRVRAAREHEEVRRRLHISGKLLYWHWPIMSLERGFSLWEAYLMQARRHVRALQDQAVEVAYESLLADPVPALRSLAAFCGLPVSEVEITCVARRARPERAYAYRDNPELYRFAARVAPRLHALAYATTDQDPNPMPIESRRRHVPVPDRDDMCAAAGR